MPLTVFSKRLPTAEPGSLDKYGQRSYTIAFEVDQTDTGALADPVSILIAAQALVTDPPPERGDTYSYNSFTDIDSFCQEITWERPHPSDKPKRWHYTCRFGPLEGVDSDTLAEPNPLLWATEYWVDWVEEQVVLRRALNVDDLPTIGRAPLTEGPVVNACGVDFTEVPMKTIYYPILNCQKAYATLEEIVALNMAFQDTTNSSTFFGAGARTAKYLSTESGRIQRVNGQSFYMGVTRIWFKKSNWDYKILNNGWTHFERDAAEEIITDGDGNPFRYQNLVLDLNGTAAEDANQPCSEPLNLALDGTILPPDTPAVYMAYRDLEEVDYSAIGIGS